MTRGVTKNISVPNMPIQRTSATPSRYAQKNETHTHGKWIKKMIHDGNATHQTAEEIPNKKEINKHNTYDCHEYARDNAALGPKHLKKTDRRKQLQEGIPKDTATSYHQNITYTGKRYWKCNR